MTEFITMSNVQIGDEIKIAECKYRVKAFYLSAMNKESYPNKLKEKLWIKHLISFRNDILWAVANNDKILSYDNMMEANKLIDALKAKALQCKTLNTNNNNMRTSTTLNNRAVTKFFDKESNITKLTKVSNTMVELVNNFEAIAKVATNIASKVAIKSNLLVNSIDDKNLDAITTHQAEAEAVVKFITESNEALKILNDVASEFKIKETKFNVEKFIG